MPTHKTAEEILTTKLEDIKQDIKIRDEWNEFISVRDKKLKPELQNPNSTYFSGPESISHCKQLEYMLRVSEDIEETISLIGYINIYAKKFREAGNFEDAQFAFEKLHAKIKYFFYPKKHTPSVNETKTNDDLLNMIETELYEIYNNFLRDKNTKVSKIANIAEEIKGFVKSEQRTNMFNKIIQVLCDKGETKLAEAISHNAEGKFYDIVSPKSRKRVETNTSSATEEILKQVSEEFNKYIEDGDIFAAGNRLDELNITNFSPEQIQKVADKYVQVATLYAEVYNSPEEDRYSLEKLYKQVYPSEKLPSEQQKLKKELNIFRNDWLKSQVENYTEKGIQLGYKSDEYVEDLREIYKPEPVTAHVSTKARSKQILAPWQAWKNNPKPMSAPEKSDAYNFLKKYDQGKIDLSNKKVIATKPNVRLLESVTKLCEAGEKITYVMFKNYAKALVTAHAWSDPNTTAKLPKYKKTLLAMGGSLLVSNSPMSKEIIRLMKVSNPASVEIVPIYMAVLQNKTCKYKKEFASEFADSLVGHMSNEQQRKLGTYANLFAAVTIPTKTDMYDCTTKQSFEFWKEKVISLIKGKRDKDKYTHLTEQMVGFVKALDYNSFSKNRVMILSIPTDPGYFNTYFNALQDSVLLAQK
jgi:hypothetical protein